MSDNIFIECKLCNRTFKNFAGLGAHITQVHNIIKEEYYKQFIDSTNTLCLNCNAPTNFINLQKGFSKYCSCKCANSHKDKILKFKLNNQEKYGVDNPSKLNSVKEKIKQTCLNKYGCITNLITDEQKELTKQKLLLNYGVEYPVQSKIILEKIKTTCRERYGVDSYSKTDEFKKYMSLFNNEHTFTRSSKYYYNNTFFDSSWELAYYIWLSDNYIQFIYHPNIKLKYYVDDKLHYYQPDFLVNNELHEIKGNHFLIDNKMINPYNKNDNKKMNAKFNCMVKNQIKILSFNELKEIFFYINKKYGKNYLKQFKYDPLYSNN